MIHNFSDHAANERTFLAWVRTGIAVVAFGLVIEKFNIFLATLAGSVLGDNVKRLQSRVSGPLGRYEGLAFIVGGLALIALATFRFVRVSRMIDDPKEYSAGDVRAELILSAGLVLLVVASSLFLIID